jgi:hypothetical protein
MWRCNTLIINILQRHIPHSQQFPFWKIFELGCLRWEGLKGYFKLKSAIFNRKYPFNPSHLKHPNSKIFQSGNCCHIPKSTPAIPDLKKSQHQDSRILGL